MKQPNLIEKTIWFIQELPLRFKQMLCQHSLFTLFSAEVFTVDEYERCSGSSNCKKCGASFTVYVPENDYEIDKLMEGTNL